MADTTQYAVAHEVPIGLLDDVAEMDADAELDTLVRRDTRSMILSWLAPTPPREERQTEPAPPPPARIPRAEIELDQEGINFLIASLGRQVRGDEDGKNPFDPSGLRPPPGIGRNGSALAMDEASGVSQWAVEGIAGFLGPREGFIGFPELAMLAQIPEYRSPVEIIATEATRIVKRFSHNVIKVNLTEAINSGNPAKMFLRAKLFNETKGNFGTMLLDKEEEFINVSVPLSGLDLLQAQAQEHIASLSRIPVVKLLGIQPAGLNASSAGELRAFEDSIHSYQEAFFRPNLEVVLRLVQLSLFGEVDPEIGFEFEPLAEELPPVLVSLFRDLGADHADPVLAIVAKLRATWHRLGKVIEETKRCEGPLVDEVHGVLDAAKAELLETPPTTLAGARAAIAWLVEYDEPNIPETSGEYMRTLIRSPMFAQEEARA